MWFRRRRRQQPPILLPSLDRLAELIERVIGLLDQTVVDAPAVAAPAVAAPPVDGHVLFVADPAGYRLLQRDGAPPPRGETLELDGGRFRVVRLGPSPLPGDGRRCAFLEREERPAPERTFDG
jgi:hypothetical protein